MQTRRSFLIVFSTLVIGLGMFPAWPEPACANPLTGDYFGSAVVTSPAGLGNIDLAFHLNLDGSGQMVPDSYITLGKTLLFPVVAPTVGGTEVGPRVTGTFTAIALNLASQSFPTVLNVGTPDEKTVTRRITLASTAVTDGGNSIAGSFTETLTGYLPQPVTVSGSFVLVRPVPITDGAAVCRDTLTPFGALTLDEIKAGGQDPTRVEFEDLACAMAHKQNPGSGLSVADQVMIDAINDYQTAQP